LETFFDTHYVAPNESDILNKIRDADAYLASLHIRFTADMIENAPSLKVIATPSTGTDHIDMEFAKKSGITVLSLKEDRDFLDRITATAELAWGLILACSRNFMSAVNAAKQGKWSRDEFRGHQLAYKTLGILGCGRLGSIVAEYGRAFRMNVIACDKVKIDKPWITQVNLDELVRQSDVLSIHIHLTEENKNLVNRELFAKMKKGMVLINTSRGGVVDEQALVDALNDGTVAAAGLDVIDGEWRKDLYEHCLIKYMQTHSNLIITPHVGGVTFESQKMAYEYTIQKLIKFFELQK
jgi:D-3-phosphoglycerate dehydrogenase